MGFKETALAKLREQSKEFRDENLQIWNWVARGIENSIETIESIPEYSGWIPVSERLPEEWKMVLISYGLEKPTVDSAQMWDSRFLQPWYDPYYFKDVTHWQPLPKPPVTE